MRDVVKETTHGKLNSTTTRVTQTKANLHTNWAFYFELQAMGSNGTPKLFGFSESLGCGGGERRKEDLDGRTVIGQ